VEKEAILKTLAATDGNRSEAARRLGITRKTLLKKLKEYGVA
jgi:two-component system response regulator HydG